MQAKRICLMSWLCCTAAETICSNNTMWTANQCRWRVCVVCSRILPKYYCWRSACDGMGEHARCSNRWERSMTTTLSTTTKPTENRSFISFILISLVLLLRRITKYCWVHVRFVDFLLQLGIFFKSTLMVEMERISRFGKFEIRFSGWTFKCTCVSIFHLSPADAFCVTLFRFDVMG